MLSRRASLLVTALLLAGLTGCTGTPAATPSPTPTAFASEEEAFAAAEETYRAYVEELNAYYAGDEDADPNAFLTGEPLQSAKSLHEQEQELGLRIEGEQRVEAVSLKTASLVAGAASVEITACVDVSDTRVLDANGEDVTPKRMELRALDVELATVKDRLVIVSSVTNDGFQC